MSTDQTVSKQTAQKTSVDHSTRSAMFPQISCSRSASAPPASDLQAAHGEITRILRGAQESARRSLATCLERGILFYPCEDLASSTLFHFAAVVEPRHISQASCLRLWLCCASKGACQSYSACCLSSTARLEVSWSIR